MAFEAGVHYSTDYTHLHIDGHTHLLCSPSDNHWYLVIVPIERDPASVIVVAVVEVNMAWMANHWLFFQPEPCGWDDLSTAQKLVVINAYQKWKLGCRNLPPWKDEPELVTLAVLGAL